MKTYQNTFKLIGLTLAFLFISLTGSAQIRIESTVPTSITVCDVNQTYQVAIYNESGSSITNPNIQLLLPDGVSYVAGSLSESTNSNIVENNITNTQTPIYTFDAVPNGDSLIFSISIRASMEAIDYLLLGNIFRNTVDLTHTGGTETHTSSAYNLLYAALNITDVSPTSQSVLSGESYTRNITVVNAGFGRVSSFIISDIRGGADLSLTASNVGTLNNDTITLSGSDFTSIGNGDAFFDNGESITIQETLQASGCNNTTVTSTINAHWGCEGSLISTSSSFASTSISYNTPNIGVSSTDQLDYCFTGGEASRQTITLTNNGAGLARNVSIDVFKSLGSGYDQTIFSRIDATSFQYRIGNDSTPITPTSTFTTQSSGDYSCLGGSPIGRAIINLPDLSPGQTLALTWDMYHCEISACDNEKAMGWEYDLSYQDGCLNNNYNASASGQSTNNEQMTLFTESPTDIHHNTTDNFDYMISSFSNELPEGDGAHYELQFTLPTGIIFDSGNELVFHSGTTTWDHFYLDYNQSTNVIIAKYALPEPIYLPKSEISLELTGDCNQPGAVEGALNIELDISYIVDTTCSSIVKIPFNCDYVLDVDLICPPTGPCEGIQFNNYDILRTSFGQSDNDQDGLADATNNLDFTKIKSNRAMVGDTLQGTFLGVVGTSAGNPTWQYGYASSDIELGSNLSSVGASVRIYDASSNAYITCEHVEVSNQLSGSDRTFTYDFSPATLATNGCAALSGFLFGDGDSIWLYTNYEVTGNIGGAVQEVEVNNEFYVSDIQNPTNGSDKYQCSFSDDKFTLIGYYFANSWTNNYTLRSCTQTIQQNFYLSIGDCCSNFAGGNLFPYEYRNWGHVKMARVVIPPHYDLVSSRVRYIRTRYTNATTTQNVNPITPVNIDGDTILYNLEQYYTSHGGNVELSDDGFHGTLFLEIAPSCDVPNNTYQDIDWKFTFVESDFLSGSETNWYSQTPDRIRFQPSALQIASSNPIQDGLEKTVTWDVSITNTSSSSNSSNAWLHLKTPSGELEIVKVIDVATEEVLALTGDIYQVGSINKNTTKNYQVEARYTACNVDRVWIYAGYECSGYPVTFSDFKCTYSQMELRVEPKPAGLQSVITGETIGSNCSNIVEVTLEVASVKSAVVDSIEVDLVMPSNGSISHNLGSSEFKYPLSNSFESISDPTQNGNTWTYLVYDLDTNITNNGLPGVFDLNSNRFQLRMQFSLENNFLPGEFIQVQVNGQEVCTNPLPTLTMAYDPSIKLEKNTLAGLSSDATNNWGAAWVDYNNDGFEDVFVSNYADDQPNVLYRNDGDGTFTKATGVGSIITDDGNTVSTTWADYDNDGDMDVFMANNTKATNRLYQNNGDGTFTLTQENEDISNYNGYCHNAAWIDYDNDGFLDLYVTDFMPTRFNRLYKNNGDGSFTYISSTTIGIESAYSIGATWADYDNDGDLDVFVPNTNDQLNFLYRNDGEGTFTKVEQAPFTTDSGNSVGSSWGDYNNDGYLDLFIPNAGNQNNFLYQNNGDGSFTKITSGIVVTSGGHSHGSSWGDIDNDGDLDLMVTNDQDNTNSLYQNNGDGTFSRFENAINTDISNSFATAWGDPDNDGDLDVFVANRNYQNNDYYVNSRGNCNAWTCFNLTGTRSNRSAIGAKVRVKANVNGNNIWQMREISSQTGGGAGSQNTLKAMFGLGDAAILDSVIIEWPSGLIQYFNNLAVNNCNDITEENGVLLSGKAYVDADNDCVYDTGEALLSNQKIIIQPGPRYVYTDENGEYETYLDTGAYTVSANTTSYWESMCSSVPVIHGVTATGGAGESFENRNFPFQPVCGQADLNIELGVTALRRGFANTLVIRYQNVGTDVATNTVLELTLDDDLLAKNSSLEWDTIIGQVYRWNIGNVGINEEGLIQLQDSVLLSAVNGTFRTIQVNITTSSSQCGFASNSASVTEEIVGAIDPNDKQVFPKGVGPIGLITHEDTLTYKIRFQNVGNYKASRVVVLDTLSEFLDYQSVHDVLLSHTGKYEIYENGLIDFTFNGIDLPDSVSNEPESHGFIQFKILPKHNAPEESIILNRAHIQFDYNEFIVTNEVINTIASDIPGPDFLKLYLYPNPAKEQTTLTILAKDIQHLPIALDEVSLYRYSGDFIKSYSLQGATSIIVESLTPGIYVVKATDVQGYGYQSKLVVID